MAESFKPPPSVVAAAVRGLALRREQAPSQKAGLDTKQASAQGIGSGVQRASDIKSGASLSGSTVRRMKNYFTRHASDYKLDPGKSPKEDKGYVAGLLWGGDAGRGWANNIVRRLDARRTAKKG